MKDIKKWIIAIDGPSAAGKSTLGKALAMKYGMVYIDTGAMYRAVAWLARSLCIDWSDEQALVKLINTKSIEIFPDNNVLRIVIDGKDVTDFIRTNEIGSGASKISALPGVKRAMIKKQQEIGKAGGVVMDGRDIGTYVFPKADYKFYLNASIKIRGLRRYNELRQMGEETDIDAMIKSMEIRDYNDSHRAVAPLEIAPDAIVIKTDNLNALQVLDEVSKRIEHTC